MTDHSTRDAAAPMRALRDQYLRKLEENDDYRALKVLEEAISKMAASVPVKSHVAQHPAADKPLSQGEAAYQLILSQRRPLSVVELLKGLAALGVIVGGANPKINLSSTLSRDDRLESIVWDDGPKWWLSNTEVPSDQ